MFRRIASRASCVSKVFHRHFGDGRSSLKERFRKASLPNRVSIVTGLLGVPAATFTWLWAEGKERKASLPYAVDNSVVFLSKPFINGEMEHELSNKCNDEIAVERCSVNKQLLGFRETLRDGKYVLILGEKGSGKSCAVYKVFKNSQGWLVS